MSKQLKQIKDKLTKIENKTTKLKVIEDENK